MLAMAVPDGEHERTFIELLRDTLEELSTCDEDDLAHCGLPAGWYGTRVMSDDRSASTGTLVIRLGSGRQFRLTVAPTVRSVS